MNIEDLALELITTVEERPFDEDRFWGVVRGLVRFAERHNFSAVNLMDYAGDHILKQEDLDIDLKNRIVHRILDAGDDWNFDWLSRRAIAKRRAELTPEQLKEIDDYAADPNNRTADGRLKFRW